MKFSCDKELLDKQLQHISRIITVRQSLPILSNILLETDKNILRISGTDLEMAMTTYLPAEVQEEGSFTVPAKIFQEFVHQNPDQTISFDLESYDLICTSSKVEARISGMDAEEYPVLPKVEKSKKIILPLQGFVEAMKKVVIACASDQTRPVLTGVYAQFIDEVATFVATDSFRLVERKISIIPVQEAVTVLIPSRAIQEIIRISAAVSEKSDLEMEINDQQILFRVAGIELYSRLLTGAFPKYQTIIPTKSLAVADVTTPEFVQALRLSSVFGQAGISNVLLEVGADGSLAVSSHGSQRGSARNVIYSLVQEGFEPIRAAFNAKFLQDACSASGADHLQLRFSGATSALVIMTEDPGYLQLVMPIRLDN